MNLMIMVSCFDSKYMFALFFGYFFLILILIILVGYYTRSFCVVNHRFSFFSFFFSFKIFFFFFSSSLYFQIISAEYILYNFLHLFCRVSALSHFEVFVFFDLVYRAFLCYVAFVFFFSFDLTI